MTPPIFESTDYVALELAAFEMPPDEAQLEFEEFPHVGFTKRWFAGLFDRDHELVGFAIVVADSNAAHVWHIALLLIDADLRGRGVGTQIYAAFEAWMRRSGARWLRLGVADGDIAAERFWAKHGFRHVRTCAGGDSKGRSDDIRVLVKPLESAGLAAYLERVPHDRSDAELP